MSVNYLLLVIDRDWSPEKGIVRILERGILVPSWSDRRRSFTSLESDFGHLCLTYSESFGSVSLLWDEKITRLQKTRRSKRELPDKGPRDLVRLYNDVTDPRPGPVLCGLLPTRRTVRRRSESIRRNHKCRSRLETMTDVDWSGHCSVERCGTRLFDPITSTTFIPKDIPFRVGRGVYVRSRSDDEQSTLWHVLFSPVYS